MGVSLSSDGTVLYVADNGFPNGLRKVRAVQTATGAVTTVAGAGSMGFADGPGESALFSNPVGVVLTSDHTVCHHCSLSSQQLAVSSHGTTFLLYTPVLLVMPHYCTLLARHWYPNIAPCWWWMNTSLPLDLNPLCA